MSTLCNLCSKKEAIYVCPRCNIPYCSLPCYQSDAHVQCSESFYKDCVVEQLSQDQLDSQSQNNMMEILQRVEQVNSQLDPDDLGQTDSDDESDAGDLADRLAGVDLDDADSVWEQLTIEERRQFEELVKSGDISDVLPPWEPWWEKKTKVTIIEDLDENTSDKSPSNILSSYPEIMESIQPLSKLCKSAPSPCVRWNVVNILAAYSLTARVFNGEHQSAAQEAAHTLVSLSDNLSANQLFDGPETAVMAVHLAANQGNGLVEGSDETQLKEDVYKLVGGPSESEQNHFVLAALSDIHHLFSNAKLKRKGEPNANSSREFLKRFHKGAHQIVSKSDLTKHLKKVEFYLSWSKECF